MPQEEVMLLARTTVLQASHILPTVVSPPAHPPLPKSYISQFKAVVINEVCHIYLFI